MDTSLLMSGEMNRSDVNYSQYYGGLYGQNESAFGNSTEGIFYRELLPWWQQLLWFLLFGGMVLVATGGNLIVIWIVLLDKRMRTVTTNIFLVNLSIADTMVSTLNVIFNFVYMLSGHWPFGWLYCKISQFIAVLSIAASVFTLMAISVDRYIAIMHPLRPRMGLHTTVAIVACIWLASAIVAAPNFIVFTTVVFQMEKGDQWIICYGEWPDGDQTESYYEYIHNIIILVLTYVIPMLSMGYTYTRMGLMLWGNRGVGEQTRNHIEASIAKRKVVKMMIVVVLIFGVCWLPFHLYFILVTQVPEITGYKYVKEIYLAIYWLAMSNSMYNPMIYCWLNMRFRNGFRNVFGYWCPCVKSLNKENFSDKRRPTVHTAVFSSAGSPDFANRTYIKEKNSSTAFLGRTTKHHSTTYTSSITRSNTTIHSTASLKSASAVKLPADAGNGSANLTVRSQDEISGPNAARLSSSSAATTPV